MSELVIREIKESDFVNCAEVISSAYNVDAEDYGFSRDSNLSPIVSRLEECSAQEARLFGAYLEEIQVGFFLLNVMDEEIYEVGKLCIHPQYQCKGYGQKLLKYALEEITRLNGVGAVCAIIDENTRLKSWLEHNGFREEFCSPISTKCSICLMQRDLPRIGASCSTECGGCKSSCSPVI